MTSISALIDFLMSLMRDDNTQRSFEADPHRTMAQHGLQNVSAQDVRDARLIMADNGSTRPRPDAGHQSRGFTDGGNDPVREIVHTTTTFEVDQSHHTNVGAIFNIDNHRTTIIDSLNSADRVTAIQDNDTIVDVHDNNNDNHNTDNHEENDKNDDNHERGTGDDPQDGEEHPTDNLPADGPTDDPDAHPTDNLPADGPMDDPADPEPEPAHEPMPEPEPLHDEAPDAFDDHHEDLPVG
jgi:hypothetical protein